jgi:hypothetical protein
MSIDPLSPLLDLSGVSEAVEESRHAVDRLLSNRTLRRSSPEVSAESLLRGAWASAVLEGSTATLAEVRAGSAGDALLQGSLRVSAELATLAEVWGGAHRQVLARLHALAAADLSEPGELGRPRPDREVAHRLDVLADVLAQTQAPAVVIAAIVQAEVQVLDAFAPVSGIVGRAAARLTLIQRGLDPKSLVPLEVGQLEAATELSASLLAYSEGGPEGVAEWIKSFCVALGLGVQESLAICEAISRG